VRLTAGVADPERTIREALVRAGVTVEEIASGEPTLEDVFVALVGEGAPA